MFASFRSRLHTKTIFVPEVRLFSISLLVCEFNPHRQTWYQKFIGTYPPLETRGVFMAEMASQTC